LKYITISTFFWVFVHFAENWQKNFSRVILLWRWENMFLLNVVLSQNTDSFSYHICSLLFRRMEFWFIFVHFLF
jgi:hypothetical protein